MAVFEINVKIYGINGCLQCNAVVKVKLLGQIFNWIILIYLYIIGHYFQWSIGLRPLISIELHSSP